MGERCVATGVEHGGHQSLGLGRRRTTTADDLARDGFPLRRGKEVAEDVRWPTRVSELSSGDDAVLQLGECPRFWWIVWRLDPLRLAAAADGVSGDAAPGAIRAAL